MPRVALPVVTAVAKPTMAPTSIMPSTPRLRTPDFSVTSSPVAARSSGVDALMTDRTRGTQSPMLRLPSRRARAGRHARDRGDVLVEQDRADHRQVGEAGDVELRQR